MKPRLDKDAWISVLKLSTQWRFNDVRKLAIRALTPLLVDPVELVCLAKQYHIHDWLLSGYASLVE
ncbi:hypothetical protein CC2G_007178 [Coprinopsis cinerea AmutBmut pab1-1]|nr:hypothetical protein CC2G_007178 [Coprinopsis cinerea AmutBmut pab1-1]